MLWSPGANDIVEPGQILMQHVTVEEQERTQRLILSRRSHPTLDSSELRKREISGAPVSAGWRLP
jgi:hypothetical protein